MSATVDLRSDTVTRPSAGMRRAMAEAELGDDVFGDDPSVNRLQARAAEMLGFEAALFFPTGTQSNLAALMSHCGRGDEYLVGQEAHTYRFEAGGGAVLGSIQPQPIENLPDGTMDLAKVEAAIKPDDRRQGYFTPVFRQCDSIGQKKESCHPPGWRAHLQRVGDARDAGEGTLPGL
jgi:threonine aldolase